MPRAARLRGSHVDDVESTQKGPRVEQGELTLSPLGRHVPRLFLSPDSLSKPPDLQSPQCA